MNRIGKKAAGHLLDGCEHREFPKARTERLVGKGMPMVITEYPEKLSDPRRQKVRLKIMERDGWKCRACGDGSETLVVHHRWYFEDYEPWDYPEDALVTLCRPCHEAERMERPGIEGRILNYLRAGFLVGELRRFERSLQFMEVHFVLKALSRFLLEGIRKGPSTTRFRVLKVQKFRKSLERSCRVASSEGREMNGKKDPR